jgi:hypothetical protein
MDDNQRADLICEVAERHKITTWEVYQMTRLVVFGAEAVDNPVFDPIEEIELQARRDRKCLEEERSTIPELLSIWQRSHDVYLARCKRQRDPAKRVMMFAKLAEREQEMAALRQRYALPDVEADEMISEQGQLAMQRFRAFRANAKRA